MSTYSFKIPLISHFPDYHDAEDARALLCEISGSRKIKHTQLGMSGGDYWFVFYDAPGSVDPNWVVREALAQDAKAKDVNGWQVAEESNIPIL